MSMTINGPLVLYFSSLCYAVPSQTHLLFSPKDTPPPGFETLNQPKKTAIDLYYGGRFLLTQLATYTSTWIKFSDPQTLTQHIPTLLHPKVILNILKQKLETHAEHVCTKNHASQTLQCGKLKPKIVGIIFDASRFRADLFISPYYLKITPSIHRAFLPKSDANISFVQQFSGNFSGFHSTINRNHDYFISGTSIFSLQENNALLAYHYSKPNSFSLNNATIEREFRGHRWATGLTTLTNFGLTFSSNHPLLGINFSSSHDTRLDKGVSSGIPIQIFTPTHGRVNIYRLRQLIYTTTYEAGNHLVNTAGFPSGAYNIIIRIYDNFGNLISEHTRFFAKDISLPLFGAPSYFIEAGNTVIPQTRSFLPKTTKNTLIRAGIHYRLLNTWSMTTAIATTRNYSLAEVSIFNINTFYKITPNIMLATDRSFGATLTSQFNMGYFVTSLSYARLHNRHNSTTIPATNIEGGANNEVTFATLPFQLLQNSFTQITVSFAIPLFKGYLNYHFTSQHTFEQLSQNIKSLSYERTLYQNERYWLTGTATYNQSHNNKLIQASFILRWGGQKAIEQTVIAEANCGKNNSATNTDYNMYYNAKWCQDKELHTDAQFQIQKTKQEIRIQPSLDVANNYGAFTSAFTQTYSRNVGKATGYTANFSTTLATDEKHIALGGNTLQKSGIIIHAHNANRDTSFAVLINGKKMTIIRGGEQIFIPLSSFYTYTINLEPFNRGFYNAKNKTYRMTLYPGNVTFINYQIRSSRLVFGRLLNKNNRPISDVHIDSTHGTIGKTDAHGIFQLQIPYDVTVLHFRKNKKQCTTVLHDNDDRDVIRVGNIICDLSSASLMTKKSAKLTSPH